VTRPGLRLLVIVYALDEDHPVLAWQCTVVRQLAPKVERMVVLTEKKGRVPNLPDNLRVIELPGKVMGIPRRLGARVLSNKFVFQLCRSEGVNCALVHMAHRWTYALYPTFRLLGIPVTTWYAHGTVNTSLRLAVAASKRVLTSSPEGCRVASDKVRCIGQAIDTDYFAPEETQSPDRVIYVGRISSRKRIDLIYEVAKHVAKTEPRISGFDLVGAPVVMDDIAYSNGVQARAWRDGLEGYFRFHGAVPQRHVSRFYRRAFLHLNLSRTGSLDKTVLEAIACGCPVLTTNPPFKSLLREWPWMFTEEEDPAVIADLVVQAYHNQGSPDTETLSRLIRENHAMSSYGERILDNLAVAEAPVA